jgi:hypothetical protein
MVRLEDFAYLCKPDTDLDLPVRYFECFHAVTTAGRAISSV